MYLDDQSVSTGRDCSEGERKHKVGIAAGVTRIDDDWQMALALDDGNRRYVERISRRRLESANAALAEHDLIVAMRHDVLCSHQQLRHRCRQSALEKNRA